MIYVVFIVFAVIVIFIININNTKSKEDANKQYFSESIKSYENFNPTYIKYGLDSEYIFAIDEHAKMLLYHRVNTEPVFLRYEDIIDAELLVEGKVVSKLSSVGIGSAIGSFGVEYGIGAIKDKAKIDALGVNILVNNITMPRLLVVCYSGYTISSSGITAITFNQVLDDANWHIGPFEDYSCSTPNLPTKGVKSRVQIIDCRSNIKISAIERIKSNNRRGIPSREAKGVEK